VPQLFFLEFVVVVVCVSFGGGLALPFDVFSVET